MTGLLARARAKLRLPRRNPVRIKQAVREVHLALPSRMSACYRPPGHHAVSRFKTERRFDAAPDAVTGRLLSHNRSAIRSLHQRSIGHIVRCHVSAGLRVAPSATARERLRAASIPRMARGAVICCATGAAKAAGSVCEILCVETLVLYLQ